MSQPAPHIVRRGSGRTLLSASTAATSPCGSGVTAAVLAFGAHLLGNDRARVYDGSWAEWGNRDDTPIER